MTARDRRNKKDFPESRRSIVRGAPYSAIITKGGLENFQRVPVPPPSSGSVGPEPTPGSGQLFETESAQSQQTATPEKTPHKHPSAPKVSFGGRPTLGRRPVVVAASAIGATVVVGAVAVVIGARLLASQSTTRQPPATAEVPAETSPPPVTGETMPSEQRIQMGSYQVVVPRGWQLAGQGAGSVQLRNPATAATIEIRIPYSGSHAGLRPQCQQPQTPVPSTTLTPSPTPTNSPAQSSYSIRGRSTVPVADSTGEMEDGDLRCPEGGTRKFATVLASSAAIGISYLGDPTDLRFLLPDLIKKL